MFTQHSHRKMKGHHNDAYITNGSTGSNLNHSGATGSTPSPTYTTELHYMPKANSSTGIVQVKKKHQLHQLRVINI